MIKFEEDLSSKLSKNIKILLENKNLTKIFHFGRFDMAVLKENLKINVKNVFCTKIASKLTRTYSSKHGLKDLVSEILDIQLDNQNNHLIGVRKNSLKKSKFIFNGDDYQILFTSSKSNRDKIDKISKITKTKISRIGKIISKKKFKFRLLNGDKVLKLTKIPGYQHQFN